MKHGNPRDFLAVSSDRWTDLLGNEGMRFVIRCMRAEMPRSIARLLIRPINMACSSLERDNYLALLRRLWFGKTGVAACVD